MRRYRSVCTALIAAVVAVVWTSAAQATITIETVVVGNPLNGPDVRTGFGRVDYVYQIGKYEVTAGQYTAFLNAVAKTDTYSLYDTQMWTSQFGCKIQRTGSSGSYVYSVAPDYANRPVNWITWHAAARFVNWLHNGQPTGTQNLSTTEDGVYFLNGASLSDDLYLVSRKPGWTWAIPSENEWYKAAFHKNDGNTSNYWFYPTSSDELPGRNMADPLGNNANYYNWPWHYPIDNPYYTTVGGTFKNSAGPYGTFDQAGNVWEWTEGDPWSEYAMRSLRGASFATYGAGAPLQATYQFKTQPGNTFYIYGFRVVHLPEPASIALLALGGLGILMRRAEGRR